MKKLTEKERKFAELCVELGNHTEAYRQAYDVTDESAEWIRRNAWRLTKKANIQRTIRELKSELAEDHCITREYIITGLLEVINDADHTFNLADLQEGTKDEVKRFYRTMNQTKNSDKLRALEQLAKMLGLNEPDKTEITVNTITIEEKKREE